MPKIFTFKGKTTEEIKKLSLKEFVALLPARQRRSIKRGLSDQQKKLLEKIQKTNQGTFKKQIKTHIRNMIVLPEMIGLDINVHNGREFIKVHITPDMLGHLLGEFSQTRKPISHSAPGLGATKSSSAIAVK